VKSERELRPSESSGRDGDITMIPLQERDASCEDSYEREQTHSGDELKKFEMVIEHFCFDENKPLKDLVASFERAVLIKVLSRFNGNQRQSAKCLGMKCSTLNEKIKKHNIQFKKKAF
jgi:DNA-binding NtrC family response regulator